MTPAEMKAVHDAHAAAENRRDAKAAAATCHPDGFIENVALGVRFEGRAQVELQYAALFAAFPDAELVTDGEAFGADVLVAWGIFRGTMQGPFFGVAPTGRRIALPFVNVVPFRDGRMLGERAYFDLATLCDQAGLALADLRAGVRALRGSDRR
jgi:predicted ester cyclase